MFLKWCHSDLMFETDCIWNHCACFVIKIWKFGRIFHFKKNTTSWVQNVTVDDACCAEGTRFISGARKIDYPTDPSALRSARHSGATLVVDARARNRMHYFCCASDRDMCMILMRFKCIMSLFIRVTTSCSYKHVRWRLGSCKVGRKYSTSWSTMLYAIINRILLQCLLYLLNMHSFS